MMHNGKTIDLGLREALKYDSGKYTPKYACTTSDRSPGKLMRLNLIAVKASRPEEILELYNSLVDAYNRLIDECDRLKETKPVGEWVYEDKVVGKRYYTCSNCTKTNDTPYGTLADEDEAKWWRFCPRCGAKMFTKEEKKND